jgi:predicted GNAT family acetyltransferase
MSDKAPIADLKVIDNPEENRYEAWVNGSLAGFAQYSRSRTRITFVHTHVNSEYEGRGVATTLARASLDAVRAQGLTVRAVCPFYSAWIARHPVYQDLLSPGGSRPAS